MNRKIVHLITGLGGGGAEQMVLKLALEAKKKDIESLVIAISSINTLEKKFRQEGISPFFLNIDSLWAIPKGLSKLHGILSKEKLLCVHCHMIHGLLIGILYHCIYKKIQIVFTLHNNDAKPKIRRVFLNTTKKIRKADILFSKSGEQTYLKNSIIIPNGLSVQKFKSIGKNNRIKPETFNFLFLGSLTEQKNPLQLIQFAKSLINKSIKNFKIDVVGDGILRTMLEQEISNNKLQSFIKLHGFCNNIPTFLKSSQCLIMPSFWEGMPVVILEAGASKLPIITTPVGSIPDIISEDEGYITPLDLFSEVMIQVYHNYDEALEKSNNFYNKVVEEYSIEVVFEKHLKLYQSISLKSL